MGMTLSELMKTSQLTGRDRIHEATRMFQQALGLGDEFFHQPPARIEPVWSARPALPSRPASFTEENFTFADERYAYRLYVPSSGIDTIATLPLVVLLHGCQQDAADFAQGTAMNALAEQRKCLVLYPEQLSRANSMRCWNWFEPAHQGRDTGEPAMIAALTRQVLDQHQGDPARVYIAGLSAGGAMAAVVARLHPELYAAVGVHSGLPPGAANDVVSAFGAMRRGARRMAVPSRRAQPAEPAMPTMVFHGAADKTVHPDNGERLVDAALAALNAAGLALQKSEDIEGGVGQPGGPASNDDGRSTQRTSYRTADGRSFVEHWAVGSGPHAWSGGDASGSFTDPLGPSASRAMLEFLLQHHK